jgi:outer membrane protein insertion porin family
MRALLVALALTLAWAAEAPAAARLAAVEWAGNARLPAGVLADSTGWRAGRSLDGAAWTALAEGVARAYAAIGNLAATVAGVSLSDTAGAVRARVTVDEGAQHRFGDIEILGARSLPAEEARRLLDAPAGEPFAGRRLERGIGRLLERYDELGRPFTQVRLRRVTLRGEWVDAQLDVVESDSAVVENVVVDGPHRTAAGTLRRALRGIEGAPYRSELAAAGRSRLLDLGVFASVGEPRFQLTAAGRGELRYAVVEAGGSSFDGIVGYQGQDNSLSGLARLALANIAGTARQADAFWQGRGAGRSEFRFRYREPFLVGTRLTAGLGFTHELEDTLYTRTEYGLEAGLPLGEGAALGLGVEGGRVVASFGPVARTTWQGTRISLRRRSRGWLDGAPLMDLFGYSAVLVTSQRFTRETLPDGSGRRGRLLTLTLDAAAERRLGERRFVTLGLEGRYRDGDRAALPVYDLFPLGGAASLRGYREDEFRAARYLLLRADHGWGRAGSRVYLFLDQAVFYRAPEAALSTGEAATRYRAGYGFGASLPSGLGRVGLEFAWGRGDGPLDAKLHLRLRSRF